MPGTHGYEQPMVEAYLKRYGDSPFELSNNHSRWLRFRAGFVTDTLRELRCGLKEWDPGAPLSATVIAQDMAAPQGDRYPGEFQDLGTWLDETLIDELYIWFRTTSDLSKVALFTRQVSDLVQGQCPLIVELSSYHVGSFQDTEK